MIETRFKTLCFYPGTYIAGGYNRLQTEVAGRVIENEDLVNMPNWLSLSFRSGRGAWFSLDKVKVLSYSQTLDMKKGVLRRKVRFRDRRGRRTVLSERRFISMASPHIAALETTITAENWSGALEVRSALDGNVVNTGVRRYNGLNKKHLTPVEAYAFGEEYIHLKVQTTQSELRIAEAARTRAFGGREPLSASWCTVTQRGYVALHI
ncbi:MAG: glycoside hydrolase family 65 protein, partial [Desulfobacterales bacterium]